MYIDRFKNKDMYTYVYISIWYGGLYIYCKYMYMFQYWNVQKTSQCSPHLSFTGEKNGIPRTIIIPKTYPLVMTNIAIENDHL